MCNLSGETTNHLLHCGYAHELRSGVLSIWSPLGYDEEGCGVVGVGSLLNIIILV